jgi:Ni2+-binding GTPase involved in maturation of urease and hydrogenase
MMQTDTAKARGERPYIFTDLTRLVGVDDVARFIAAAGGLPAPMSEVA